MVHTAAAAEYFEALFKKILKISCCVDLITKAKQNLVIEELAATVYTAKCRSGGEPMEKLIV